MKVVLEKDAIMPNKAHENDAGFDIYSREFCTIPAHGSHVFDTGVHVEIPVGSCGMLKSKSGLNVKYGIISEGVIDCGYTGSICAKLYNLSGEDYTVRTGDKITQLVVMPIASVRPIQVDTLGETERGACGFGSTGR